MLAAYFSFFANLEGIGNKIICFSLPISYKSLKSSNLKFQMKPKFLIHNLFIVF